MSQTMCSWAPEAFSFFKKCKRAFPNVISYPEVLQAILASTSILLKVFIMPKPGAPATERIGGGGYVVCVCVSMPRSHG